jgi:hypothetical protein
MCIATFMSYFFKEVAKFFLYSIKREGELGKDEEVLCFGLGYE